jgi:hypothetical protein
LELIELRAPPLRFAALLATTQRKVDPIMTSKTIRAEGAQLPVLTSVSGYILPHPAARCAADGRTWAERKAQAGNATIPHSSPRT